MDINKLQSFNDKLQNVEKDYEDAAKILCSERSRAAAEMRYEISKALDNLRTLIRQSDSLRIDN